MKNQFWCNKHNKKNLQDNLFLIIIQHDKSYLVRLFVKLITDRNKSLSLKAKWLYAFMLKPDIKNWCGSTITRQKKSEQRIIKKLNEKATLKPIKWENKLCWWNG